MDVPILFCVVCREPIPEDRAIRGAVTCTKEHAKLKKQQARDYRSSKKCKYCGRPPLRRRLPKDSATAMVAQSEAAAPGASKITEVVNG